MISIHKYFGLAGVDENEDTGVRRLGKLFQICTILIIYTLALQWEMHRVGTVTTSINTAINWFVLGFFVLQTVVISLFVRKKTRYLAQNWLNIVIICGGIALLINYPPLTSILKNLRPLLVVWLLIPWLDASYHSLSDNHLGTTIVTALLFMILAGIIITGIDPAIGTPIDGIWWAWVTMSTVGYGDVVPVSGIGRLFGSVLILMGLGLFSIITANFSAIFVQRGVRDSVREVKKEGEEIRLILKNIQAVRHEEKHIEDILQEVREHIYRLEDKIDQRK